MTGVWERRGTVVALRLTGATEMTLGEDIETFFLPRQFNKTGSNQSEVGLLRAQRLPGSLLHLFSVVIFFSLAPIFSLSSLMLSAFSLSPSSLAFSKEAEEKMGMCIQFLR